MSKKLKIFTLGYFPFVMGGRVWQEICIEVENAEGPYDIEGYQVCVVKAPDGTTFVVEATSGALVGPNLEIVRNDITSGDKEIMDQQVAEAVEKSKKARMIEPEEFWRMLGCDT